MKLIARFLLSTALAPALSATSASDLAAINDAAAFLAGESLPHHQDHPLTSTGAWLDHVSRFGREFAGHRDRVLIPMSDWSATEVGPVQPAGATVRYLFSGPDILHAFHMFPTAGTYLLCGLEPVGVAPDISSLGPGNVPRALSEVRNALGEILQLSFFRTKDMKEDLQFATFRGTTPLMMIFLAKSGQYVKELEFLSLQKDGTLVSRGRDPSGANGVRLVFSPRRVENSKTLYYFCADLSNGGFESSGFGPWIATQPRGSAYLKAASFLMHDDWFSKVRDHLLAHSDLVIEDDSGIPYARFDAGLWEATFYGVYTGPIDLFKNAYQADLAAAYGGAAQPLPFGTGYKWRPGESNLMRFVRRDRAPVESPALRAEEVTPASSTDPRIPSEGTASASGQ